MATLRYKKVYNKWYVYEVAQYWDKTLKKPRQKVKYLGVSTKKGGEYHKPRASESKEKESTEIAIVDYGDSYCINEICKTIGLSSIIETVFSNYDSLMALICFQITEGAAMYNCIEWFKGNIAQVLFPTAAISSQNISKLLQILGDENLQQLFFKKYIKQFFPKQVGLLIDSTALPSQINQLINAYGYANGEIEQNIGCLMLVDKLSHYPIYFRALSGDIVDASTLKVTLEEIKSLGLSSDSAILDAGYCSKDNLQFLCQKKINFITRLPKTHKVFHELINEHRAIESKKYAVEYNDRIVFISSVKKKIYGQELYAHIILDPKKKSKDTHLILKDSFTIELNDDDTDAKLKNAGYFILLSSYAMDKEEVLPSYYQRQTIEQVFSFAKSNNSLLPLRVHSETSAKGYMMLIFLTLILFIDMKKKINIPMEKALLILRSLKAKVYDDQNIIVQELSKKTKDIFASLKIKT